HGSRNDLVRGELLASGAKEVYECSTYHYSKSLESGGAKVLGEMGFKYEAPDEGAVLNLIRQIVDKRRRRVDAITFTSPPAAANLFEIAAENGLEEALAGALRNQDEIIVVAVGSSTKSELEVEHGIRVHVMPEVPGMGAMTNALASYVKARRQR
ncbi:MAG: uroporphyrinogen-III synthase, partial [Thaumarchaeota archaeon]|nr:uroporphyrinogen-III synthase [Nitrososphaerota archaeon]